MRTYTCMKCPASKICLNKFREAEFKSCDVLILQDFRRSRSHNGFTNESLQMLSSATRNTNYKTKLMSLCEIYAGKEEKIPQAHVEYCYNVLVSKLINTIQPRVVVTLGATALKIVLGKDKKITKWAGMSTERDGISYLPIYNPEHVLAVKSKERSFKSHVLNIEGLMKPNDDNGVEYTAYYTEEEIVDRLNELCECGLTKSFDYETTGLIPYARRKKASNVREEVVCISIAWAKGKADMFYFFDLHKYMWSLKNNKPYKTLLTPKIRKAVAKWLSSDCDKVCQNAKFEIKWSQTYFGCTPVNLKWDTKQIAHLIDEEMETRLTNLAHVYTDMGGYDSEMTEFLSVDGNEHWMMSPDKMLKYSAGDSDCTLRIFKKQISMKEFTAKRLYHVIVRPTYRALANVENRGMKVDIPLLEKYAEEVNDFTKNTLDELHETPFIEKLLKKINKDPKKKVKEFNINSSVQMKVLLYSILKLPVLERSKKTKEPSTKQQVLEKLMEKTDDPTLRKIMDFRSLSYQKTTIDQILDKCDRDTGTVFSDLVQDFVVTGRLSSRNPNLQNLTNKTNSPIQIKKAFVSRWGEDGLIGQADYKQLELRLVGSEAEEPLFIKAFEDGIDMHSLTASIVYKIPIDEIMKYCDDKSHEYYRFRRAGKSINFGTVYGITEHGLSDQMGVSVNEAKHVLNEYWNSYSGIASWVANNEKYVKKNLKIYSSLGRVRHLPNVNSSRWWESEPALRQASNFRIQSLGADICNWTMSTIDEILIAREMDTCVIGQIHDSVLLDIRKKELNEVIEIVKYVSEIKSMKLFNFLKIPLKVDVEVGPNWFELKKLK